MADNVITQSATLATVPASTTIATDDVGGAHYQRIKLDIGGDGVSVPVVASVPAKEARASSGSTSNVSDTASSTQLLASNGSRLGFRILNDSASTLYVKFGTTASLTDYTVKMVPDAYLEETQYTGRVDGIWSSDSTGAARITELT